ncbi:hypothetical protein [Methylobacterium aquaticum]|uniref:Uncharacterized protein n=1 Tax=Methylobacterium aquaticum TaxID=270351 RepID=A0A0J6SLI5_9HYPH|nr:hypothetical protein [Methylobacterium aquaticum]KMO34283.1 hypothetical protein VP06_14510 [Methylobacterium aquaticum]
MISGMDLGEMLEAASRGRSRGERNHRATSPEVLCVTLKEIEQRYRIGCQFKPGDLVTPRPGYTYDGEGAPHVVLDVLAKPVMQLDLDDPSKTASNSYGRRIDMRVACEHAGIIAGFWVESWCFEKYTGPIAEMHPGA